MKNSIIQVEEECFFTGRTTNLERHHVFFGTANRKNSDKYGLWVWLSVDMHRGKHGVHHNKEFDLILKEHGQKAFEELCGHDEFMRVFGRNYL